MKITRRKNGYSIRCNDGDFAMLKALVDATPVDAAKRMLTENAKASHTRRLKGGDDILRIDVDNRAAA